MKAKHITNITYQDFYDIYYYVTYPNVKSYTYGISLRGDIYSLVPNREKKTKYDYDRIRGLVSKIKNGSSWYNIKNEMEGSTTIESIIYEKHIGEEVSRVGLKPILARKGGNIIYGNSK